ncbi:hypothetical protein GURASL_37190 [Geotalea uraniireducens]|uniref:DUF2288 domain-containing protein n=1 Tax=Geotalea uraniireducens TaxID=351604 RepID=A0ABN6VZ02_9BACT|nr:DUF2288 domain-containing protein [Geotalea uraniireducens]BDV44796.1 hypothetical protein GURASL_37190 [Geotalea uraniireducens]
MKTTQEELATQIDEAQWDWLRAHLERGGLICVAADLDIAAVGERIAADDAASVQTWIETRKLTKPTAEQIAAWDGDQTVRFTTLIISPYVLIQEKLHG